MMPRADMSTRRRASPTSGAALEGARSILIDRFAEDAELVGGLRHLLWDRAEWTSTVVDGKQEEGAKFSDYFSASEPLRRLPSHRVLALFRGRDEGILRLKVVLPHGAVPAAGPTEPERRIAARAGIVDQGRPADAWLAASVRSAWKIRLLPQLESEIEHRLRDEAEIEAIRVFGRNLHDLLLAAPAGQRTTMGLDPGIRTGVKVAVVDGTGKLLDTAVIYPHEPRKDWEGALSTLARLCKTHRVELVSIGNGTASQGDGRARGGPDVASCRPAADADGRVGGGRLGLLGVGAGGQRISRARRVAARRGVDRAASPGSAGRARSHRPEGDRRRPVSARREPGPSGQKARRRRRRLRQRRRRRRQHRIGAASGADLRAQRVDGETDRRPSATSMVPSGTDPRF